VLELGANEALGPSGFTTKPILPGDSKATGQPTVAVVLSASAAREISGDAHR
jgi:hypothetical protein